MAHPDLSVHPLCSYFLSGYLSSREDPTNFPPDECPALWDRYERLFESGLQVLGLTKEALKGKPEFNFDSGDAANLESGMAILRVSEALRQQNFVNVALVRPRKNAPGADLTCEKNGQKVCLEVKTITKQSSGLPGCFFESQLYEKIRESVSKARAQLEASAKELQCTVKILVCVVNWLAQSIYLNQEDYQQIVNRLERDGEQKSLTGVDGVLFVTKMGLQFLFLNERGKLIDLPSMGPLASGASMKGVAEGRMGATQEARRRAS